MAFSLDPRIVADTEAVAVLPLCHVRLMDDRRFPWLILVPARAGAVEIVDLDAADRGRLIEEVAQASSAMRAVFRFTKLNLGALGNIVAQLHVHVVARTAGDDAWPGPVWGTVRVPYAGDERARTAASLRDALARVDDAGVTPGRGCS
jgi:diadenosine tetraphosphate (Ap4A) HIT family hydrolase